MNKSNCLAFDYILGCVRFHVHPVKNL